MPKSALTGTQKKSQKVAAREHRKTAPVRKKAISKEESYLHGGGRDIKIDKDLKKIMAKEKAKAPSISKLAEFKRGGPAYKNDETFKNLSQYNLGGKGLQDRESLSKLKDFERHGGAYKEKEDFKGLKPFEHGGKAYKGQEDFSGLDPFGYKGKAYQKPDFAKDSRQGLELANEALAPIQQQTLRQYGQNTIPGLINSLGGESKKSSALNQALSTARNNLAENLNAQTAGLAIGYGGDISKMNLGERARQQELQYNAEANQAAQRNQQQQYNLGMQNQTAQNRAGMNIGQIENKRALQAGTTLSRYQADIGQNQFLQSLGQQNAAQQAQMNIGQNAQNKTLQYGSAADIYNAQNAQNQNYANQQRSALEYRNNLNLGAARNLQNAGMGGQGAIFQPAYLQKGQSGPSTGATIGAGALQAAGTIGGALLGGPAGAMAGYGAGKAASTALFNTNQM